MESKCDRCNSVCPSEYMRKGVITDEFLCPECYDFNKAKTVLCLVGTFIVVMSIIGCVFYPF